MTPAIEDTAASATPAGAGQPGAGLTAESSHAIVMNGLIAFRDEIAYNGSVLYQQASPQTKTERRQLVTVRRSYAAIRSNLMPRYVLCYQYKARIAKMESPQHKLAGDISRFGGAL